VAKTANEQVLEATIRHQIKLLRFSQGQANSAAKLLAESDKELMALLEAGLTETSEKRVRSLLAEVRRIRRAVAEKIEGKLSKDNLGLAKTEAEWEGAMIEGSVPVALSLESVAPATLRALAGSPINGVPLKGWLGNMVANDVKRVEQQMRLGILQGETVQQLTARIRGTKANGYKDGVLAATRREAEMIARTSANHVSAAARQATWEANSDIIRGVRWVATLDGRTSHVCAGRDGEVYPLDKGPRPPAHPNCRSSVAPVLDGEEIVGERPVVRDARTRRQREIDFRDEARTNAGDEWKKMSTSQRDAAVKSLRDDWADEHIGQVPTTTNYEKFLREQSKEFQDDFLGRGKAKLFRDGMPLDKFTDENGRPYSLEQLQAEVAGDKLNVVQPGVGLKAKSYLQQGMSNQEVVDAIKAEFPDANTTTASVASYKTELKKAGMLDLPEAKVPAGSLKKAQSAQAVVDDLDGHLPENVKGALGGQWSTVVDELEGSPGAYGYYQAGKGVQLSGKKLASIPQVQAKQVAAHELGHLLNKQHELRIPDDVLAAAKASASSMSPELKKLYSYYFTSADELVAEIYAQALSPSALTSQGLSALEFNKAFGPAIDAAKKAMADKWPSLPPGTVVKPTGGPTMPFEVAGKHTSVGSLAKALLQQGVPDQQVLDAVLKEFPNAKTKMASIASYKSELKKAGALPNKASGPTVAAKPISKGPAPGGKSWEEYIDGIKPSTEYLPLANLKEEVQAFMKVGLTDEKALYSAMQKVFPKNFVDISPGAFGQWVADFNVVSAKAAAKAAGDIPKPYLLDKPLGPTSKKALEAAKGVLHGGGSMQQAKDAMKGIFGSFNEAAGNDLLELAQYDLAVLKAQGKPYISSLYSAKAPAPVTAPAAKAPSSRPDMTPTRSAATPRDGLPPPPRFTSQQRAWAVRHFDGRVDTKALNAINEGQKRRGLPEVEPEEAAAIRAYTGGIYGRLNSGLRNGSYSMDAELQAYVDAAQHGLQKMPKYKGLASRGMNLGPSELHRFLSSYQKGSVVEEAAFVSSSAGEQAAFSGNVFLKIDSKTGVDVAKYSRHPGEREVLFMPGVRFRVDDITKDSYGRYIVKVTEV
jgi:SPP1 gp7 family putative phage head morphogenesis protein